MAIWRDLTVGVQKNGFMVDTLRHYNIGPNVVFETLGLYVSSVWRPREATQGHARPPEAPGAPLEATEASSHAQPGTQNLVL